MRGVRKCALFAAMTLLAAGLAACGGGDSGDTTAASTASTAPTAPTTREPAAGGGSASFLTPGGDNSIQNFGEEAGSAELAEASTVLGDYLEARAEDDWAGQCTLLAEASVAPLEQLAARSPQFKGKGKGCAEVLKSLMGGAPASTRANTLTNGVASLRTEGDRGFALYHGSGGTDYFVPMVREDGEWKVGAFAPTEFP